MPPLSSPQHIILCFSPIGEAFRERLRQFPSLINCCTIDWYSEWPEDALISVSRKFLAGTDLGGDEVRVGTDLGGDEVRVGTHLGGDEVQ